MHATSHAFKANAREALADTQLQRALSGLPGGLVAQRTAARARLPEFEDLRDVGADIRNHTLDHLDLYLEAYEKAATAAGARVHWARTGDEANGIILDICRAAGARLVTKGKSMVSEEIGLNGALIAGGLEVVETDLGEYILQIRDEAPSHIVAPVIHLTQEQVEADFRRTHTHLPHGRRLDAPVELVDEARGILRQKFVSADVGITGANFLVAETGSSIIVTNEGNGDLTQSLAKTHIVITSIDKVVPTLEDVSVLLRLLARSATGQDITTYTTFSTGPRRQGDPDGPAAYHVVLVDNGRTDLYASNMREVLRCIRCAACMNHCPVYNAVGGHAYGWVYPGPIGAVLTPGLIGVKAAASLPNASTFCGKCEAVCPMKIPLPKLMRQWREAEFEAGQPPLLTRAALAAWGALARRPNLYHMVMRASAPLLKAWSRGSGSIASLPLAAGWTRHRDLPAPQGQTFQQLWRATRNSAAK
ncbi:MAG: LutB/LldF family L-lactate oxidation iron-sulfur protein [Hyphomicrobiaceae bacterium]|nr:LutB/LldF family L-lactate oxidation iron-sulfur protein [Hyphomicrobiaceae bacterium]